MANGILPFPTFGGEKSPGIMSVKLPTVPVRFPTAQRTRRTPEPTTKEKLAGLAPLLVQGLGGLFGGEDTPRTPEQYAMDQLGLTEQQLLDGDLNKFQQAQLDAYRIYGEPAPKDDFGFDEIANIAAASMMGRGAGDYVKTYLALKKDAKAKEATKEISRADFIKSRTDANLQNETYIDFNSLKQGIWDPRDAKFDPDTGSTLITTDDKEDYADILDEQFKGRNYVSLSSIIANGVDPSSFIDKNYQTLATIETEILNKDRSAMQFVNIAGEAIEFLDNPDSTISTVANVERALDSALTNIDQIANRLMLPFATAEDVRVGIDSGTGALSSQLYNALRSENDEQQQAAMAAFEKENETVNFREILGDRAYENVRVRSLMLQMAYLAAAANGQTGRTLSDKDLAYHLEMVGFGASDTPQVVKKNIIGLVNQILKDTDTYARSSLPINTIDAGRYGSLDTLQKDEQLQGFINVLYDVDGKNYKNTDGYRFKNILTRHRQDPSLTNWYATYGEMPASKSGTNVSSDQEGTASLDDTILEELSRRQ